MNPNTVYEAALFSKIKEYPGVFKGSCFCRESCYMHLYGEASPDGFREYVAALINDGFVLLQQTENNGNLFAALKKDVAVTVYYTPSDNSARIAVSLNDGFPVLSPSGCSGSGKTVFYAFENDHTLIDCGMCLLTQCPDGSFFIVDSGHYFQFNDNDRLYKFMRERTPADKKVVINGWFITHAHTDHVSKLIDFLLYNTTDVIIEGFYQNLMPTENIRDSENHEEKEVAEKLFHILEKYPAPVYKLHSGMRFYIRNLTFDVLYTHEDAYPDAIEDYNDSSTVLMMNAEGTRIFIPGDASVFASTVLEARFSDSLECDVIQIAHHGHTGLSEHCYELLNGKAAVFPVTRVMFEQDIERHAADRRAIALAEKYYITSDGTVCIPLPYDKDSIFTLPDETTEDFEKIKRLWRYDYPRAYKDYIYEKFIENGGNPEKLLIPSSKEGWIEPKPWIEGC